MAFSAAWRARSASAASACRWRRGPSSPAKPAPTPARSRGRAPRPARRTRAPSACWPDRAPALFADLLALEEGVVGGEVLRGLLREPLLLPRPERDAQRLSHPRRDVRLHLEDVRQRRVERLLPLRGRRAGARHLHELGAHVDAARAPALFPAHGRGQEVADIQLLGDLLRASSSSSCRASSCPGRSPGGPAARSACPGSRLRCRRRSSRPRAIPGSRRAARPHA